MYLISVLVHTFYLLASRQKEWDNKDVCNSDGSGFRVLSDMELFIKHKLELGGMQMYIGIIILFFIFRLLTW